MTPFISAGLIPRSSLSGCSLNSAQLLRAIGQALDRLSIDTFRLHHGDYSVVIRELAKGPAKQFRDPLRLRARLRDLNYSFQEIESLDRQARGNRQKSEGMPDPDSLTNILRAAGAHVDLNSGQLMGVTKAGDQSIEIRYQNIRGCVLREVLDATDLYSLFVSVYLKRAGRSRQPVIGP